MRPHFRPLLIAFLLILPLVAEAKADVVVVANPRSGIDRLSRDEVINIFLGRFRQLSSGLSVQPVDLPATQPEKATFYLRLVNKDLAEINAYWSRLVFSGRTEPPVQAKSTEDLVEFIAKTPGAIGYMERSKVDGRVKLVFEP